MNSFLFPAAKELDTSGSFHYPYSSAQLPDDPGKQYQDQTRGQRDLFTQTAISLGLGCTAFITFCILRPKWRTLYAARRRLRTAAAELPELPDTLFGWIPVLFKINDDDVLKSAGLDAYVFLSFFSYAIRFLTITLFFSVTIILPIHYVFAGKTGYPWDGDGDEEEKIKIPDYYYADGMYHRMSPDTPTPKKDPTYLWMYVVFTYLFTGLAIHLLLAFTNRIIQIRQHYLGGQTTLTDRTIRLSGIPPEMRDEEQVKDLIEKLNIGNVDTVMLCRDWKELDNLIEERKITLQRLENAWTEFLGYRYKKRRHSTLLPAVRVDGVDDESNINVSEDTEQARLLHPEAPNLSNAVGEERERPKVRIWYGPLQLRFKKLDAIDYFEERLRVLDEKIETARDKEFPPTALAFVTMESTASCQMAVQAILDPSPMQFVASVAPAPADVVWQHTYLSRPVRMIRSWSITLAIGILTIFWSILLVPLAYLLNLETIEKVIPSLADALTRHPVAKSLVQTGLPTLTLSLLNIAVPYLHAWLATLQGMTSRGDVELSIISKNFFFTFFNLFLVFTVFATASNFYGFWENIRDVLKDTTMVAFALAKSLETIAPFYVNLIILQGLGLFPFRLLEFGSVFMYPFQLLGARTPRDYADLGQPPTFSYGFALPQTLLIFIICVVYSVSPSSWLVCFVGVIYFILGRFIYKYQLLYAMDHQQHSTGLAWPMICSRIILALVVFQLEVIGVLALRTAITRSVLIVPLLGATVWFSYWFSRTYEPLMKFIALRSIDRNRASQSDESPTPASTFSPPSNWERDAIPLRLRGEDIASRPRKYINPNLVVPLDDVWIPGRDEASGA